MTIRERLEELLVKHGLWPHEASAVLEMCENAPENEAMQGRWADDVTGYSVRLLAALWLSARHEAVAWIDANKPKHFAKAMLDERLPGV